MNDFSKLKFHIAEVLPYDYTYKYVNSDQPDTNIDTLFAIYVRTYTNYYDNEFLIALPANSNIKQIPLVGEHVLVFRTTNQESSKAKWRESWYYLPLVGLKAAINENRLPGLAEELSDVDINKRKPGKTFQSREISPLQPYEGDLLIEGRWGNSIRFSSTITTNGDYTIDHPWRGDVSGDPILIISNGRKNLSNKQFVVENIQDDQTSIYLTSTQRINNLTTSNPVASNIAVSDFNTSQLIGVADRVILKSKTDSVILDGKRSIEINAPTVYIGSADRSDKEGMLHSTAVVSLLQKIVSIIKIGFADSSGVVCTPLYDALADAEQLFQELTNDNILIDKYQKNNYNT
jgi:hypothetical protein